MNTKVAIVGCGAISRVHVAALRRLPGVEIAAACDRDRWRAGEIAALAGGAAVHEDLGGMLREVRPDAVHVLTPPSTHADLAVAAMEAGCHALVEKPMALTAADADRMIAASRAHKVLLGANHNYLFKPSVARARRLVESGALGRVVFVHAYYGLSGERSQYAGGGGRTHWAWSLPGGAFTNFLPHVIYLQLAFLGEVPEVRGVTLESGAPGGPPTEMTVLLGGPAASGVMTVSMRTQPYAKFVDVFGTRGMLRADLVREICTVQREQHMPRMLSKALFSLGESAQLVTGIAGSTFGVVSGRLPNYPGLHEIVRRFYAAVREGGEAPAGAEQGRDVARVLEQIRERSPRPPVAVAAAEPGPGPRNDVERRIAEGGGIPGPVLVTGASGFLGHRLIAALTRCGTEVTGLARNPALVSEDLRRRARIVAGDLRDGESVRAALRGAALVYHCAAVTTNSLSWSSHEETNVRGTEAVLSAAREAGVRRVVHASSVAVYGLRPPAAGPVRETSPYAADPDRWAYYLRSKLEADRLAREAGRDGDLPLVILRFGILHGPGGGKPLYRDVLRIGSVHFTIGTGGNRLPFTYIDNAVDACLLAAVSPAAAGREYNVVDEPQRTVRDCAQLAARVEGSRFVPLPVPVFLLTAAARVLEARQARSGSDVPPKLTRYVVQSASRDVRYDTTRAREELGWSPAVSLEEALRRTREAETT